jgi:hypothetical protein
MSEQSTHRVNKPAFRFRKKHAREIAGPAAGFPDVLNICQNPEKHECNSDLVPP